LQLVLNRQDKEQLVVKLYQEGKSIREIAQQAHLSFGTIGKIVRQINGLGDDEPGSNQMNNKSKPTKALYLFLHGKRPVDVAIELDLSASEVHEMQEEFWALDQLHELEFVYDEIKTFLPSFLKLFHCLKERRMLDEKNISKFIRNANYDLSDLENRVQCLSNEIINLEGQKRNSMNKVILWSAQLSDLGKAIDHKNQQLKRMGK
jgi:transposase